MGGGFGVYNQELIQVSLAYISRLVCVCGVFDFELKAVGTWEGARGDLSEWGEGGT